MHRRQFLSGALLAGASVAASRLPAGAIDPIIRPGKSRVRLSVAAYSFRQSFAFMRGEARKVDGRLIDMPGFFEFCAEHGADAVEPTSYFFKPDPDDAYFRNLRRLAHLRGIAISGTAVGNNFALPEGREREAQIADVKRWVDRAAVLGAPHIRVFSGAAKGIPAAEARKLCVAALEECCEYAGSRGIFLGLENHGGLVAEAGPMLELVHAVQSPWFGVSLDTGNFHTADPYGDLARLAPYSVNVQLKVEMRAAGQKGNEPADLDRIAKILRDAAYQGYVALEYEANGDPWKEVPRWLGEMREAFG